MKKAIVLSSGGVDSTTCVGVAVNDLGAENVITVSVYYGQRHKKELDAARSIASYYNVEHYELDLSTIMEYSDCSLLSHSTKDIQHGSYAEQIEKNGKVETYVPFRNGLMLSAVAAMAIGMFPDDEIDIYLGAHSDDAAGNAYADCSKEFTDAIGTAISVGTYNQVHLKTPFVNMHKADVVRIGLELNVPYNLTWSCYEGEDKPCGKCGTCIDRAAAFALNGIKDPAL